MFLPCLESLICLFPTDMFIVFLVYRGLVVLGFQFSLLVIYWEVQLTLSFLVWRFSINPEVRSGWFPAEHAPALCSGVTIAVLKGIH